MRPRRPVFDEDDVDRCPVRIGFDRRQRVVIVAVVTDEDAEGRFDLRAKRLQDGEDVVSLVENGDEDIEPRGHALCQSSGLPRSSVGRPRSGIARDSRRRNQDGRDFRPRRRR